MVIVAVLVNGGAKGSFLFLGVDINLRGIKHG